MLDIKLIRERTEWVESGLRSRGKGHDLEAFRQLEVDTRAVRRQTEQLQARRNAIAKEIGRRKASLEAVDSLMMEMQVLAPQLRELESRLREGEDRVRELLFVLPNLPHPSVPIGEDEGDNQVVRCWPEDSKPALPEGFTPLAHWELGERLGILDFEAGRQLAGARLTVLRGDGARLSRALGNFMLELHTSRHGYTEILPPLLVNRAALVGTGQLPKFEEELFRFRDDPYYLIPTAEVPLTNLVRDRILEEAVLPIKMVGWTSCFRREAGSAGKDTRGLIRQHQFDKVELVQVVEPSTSYDALEALTSHAEEVLRQLQLPYRVVSLCSGDLGFAAAKTYDLEVWLPGQGCYREISSCSNTEGFQSRRMNTRYRRQDDARLEPVHTLNGSGVAIGRALVAVLENFQQPDGRVVIPEVLRPYLGGQTVLG